MTKNKHEGGERAFIQLSRAWYGPANLEHIPAKARIADEITIGFYYEEGGTTGELTIEWVKLSGRTAPRLKAFDDSWDALWQCRDLLGKMAEIDDQNITPEAFCKILEGLGIKDRTPEKEPNH